MVTALVVILVLILLLPFVVKQVEHNLEYFLFTMGIISVIVSKQFSVELFFHIFKNPLIYYITLAVLIAGLIFALLKEKLKIGVEKVADKISLRLFAFIIIVILGLMSSIITAIIASLVLVEVVNYLPLTRKNKINLIVIACFSIGLGAALTPVGEPLATIVVSKLHADFFYLARLIGIEIIIAILALGLIGTFFAKRESGIGEPTEDVEADENIREVFIRAFKVFVFIFALELLGTGFKPIIDLYIVKMKSEILYWVNTISAIVDNATLAAAEISPSMTPEQIRAILMGMLISGGMLIPGNIPNIISAGKLKIKSTEWARIAVPLGAILLIVYYIVLFVI
ncbi:putative cation transporter [Caldanaerobacter subterraneus subsp. tengcongensis MB4]|uniref:Cation transporter n=1 Tax=Caldanaerobacter subterraneus subsp. tengcongensis (strain DSM 15242 / JCM 11007 / NBRC 100824 / MB4) TaxID=273068 RepID=Q8R782_CALS4|nr:DUF1646 domain-containing protein [Caldanaerobacter subterraneus]AAM25666.1 conserved hypothetical protein [Caldanaerobacter subterraneus subsp. tengcongensis MB4]MCS3917456.1 putative cation transporter [Caldanaerobacter subterraneus subsp. tengcongensis MB4]